MRRGERRSKFVGDIPKFHHPSFLKIVSREPDQCPFHHTKIFLKIIEEKKLKRRKGKWRGEEKP